MDEDLGTVRVARLVGAFDCGRVLNPTTARSQLMGGMIMGVGAACLEGAHVDREPEDEEEQCGEDIAEAEEPLLELFADGQFPRGEVEAETVDVPRPQPHRDGGGEVARRQAVDGSIRGRRLRPDGRDGDA